MPGEAKPDLRPATYLFSCWLFLKLIGVVSLIAFISYWVQADGLIGEHGILPYTEFLQNVDRHWQENDTGISKFWLFPTLLWLNQSTGALTVLFIVGIVASSLLIAGLATPLAAMTAWITYLSLTTVGGVFLSFQWDILLLETLFLTVFFSPLRWLDRLARRPHPPTLVRWLIWFLLFRLMFESGLVKLTYFGAEGQNTWRDFTALDYHYWTQPLPTWTSWLLHWLPEWLHRISLSMMFAVELACPFLIWFPRKIRMVGFSALFGFQILIAASGNYGFFNLLSASLCLALVDDQSLPRFIQRFIGSPHDRRPPHTVIRVARLLLLSPLCALILWQGINFLQDDFRGNRTEPGRQRREPTVWEREITHRIQNLHLVNPYGLFRVMTRTRPEIVIEGSVDGLTWKPYVFKWKPVSTRETPEFTTPHMPRLDWQMWFVALHVEARGTFETAPPWFSLFVQKLAQNNNSVLSLLRENPFPQDPPRLLRLHLYHYTFCKPEIRRTTGAWWERKLLDRYTMLLRVN